MIMNLVEDLNILLADLAVFYRKLQNYHWNITGKDFFVIHEKLEEYYNDVNESIDIIGEHILTLKGQPVATLKDYLGLSTIQEATNKKIKPDVVIHNLIFDFNEILKKSIQIKEKADEQKEYTTSNIMDDLMQDYTKKIWMLEQSME